MEVGPPLDDFEHGKPGEPGIDGVRRRWGGGEKGGQDCQCPEKIGGPISMSMIQGVILQAVSRLIGTVVLQDAIPLSARDREKVHTRPVNVFPQTPSNHFGTVPRPRIPVNREPFGALARLRGTRFAISGFKSA